MLENFSIIAPPFSLLFPLPFALYPLPFLGANSTYSTT
jgi:hypothetical protein